MTTFALALPLLTLTRIGAAAGLGLALLLLLPGCDQSVSAPERLVLAEGRQPAFGLLYIAEREGFFRDEGLEVSFQHHDSGRDALAAVVAGQADVATPFDIPVVINLQQGRPIRVLSTLSVMQGYNAVIARRDRGITAPDQLRGKRIATVPNSSADYALSLVLTNAGVAPTEVELVPQSPAAAAEALIRGEVDAAAIWSPHTQHVENQLGAAAVAPFTSPLYMETATLSTTESVLRTRPEALKRLLRALVRAEDLATRDPERARQHVTATLDGLPAEDVRETWRMLQPQVRLDNLLLTTLNGELAWYASLPGQAETAPVPGDLRPFLAAELLRGVRPQAVTLRQDL
ncbi:MAG: transporter substrate-binding domain-containing protein [Gammaproteobacteria bacterium]|jgi:NitT/TauT family transport system substrate-binding protein|nr:transporter substrate-binding domain-containing protein [Gammaproteobacteria bacterium]